MGSTALRLFSALLFTLSLACGTYAFAYNNKSCQALFRVHLDETALSPIISNIQLISKYAANINRVRAAIDRIVEHPPITAEQKVTAGRELGEFIAREAFDDQPRFWRLLHVTLTDDRIPYSQEFYEALLSRLFETAHFLIHFETQKAPQYEFFKKLIDSGFRPLLLREVEWVKVRSAEHQEKPSIEAMPVEYYSKKLWLRAYGTGRAETTIRTFWKDKASTYRGIIEAERDGRNLAEHIRMRSPDMQTYVRFYFIVLTQFRPSNAEAFYRGFLDQKFAIAFPEFDSRTRRHLQYAIESASELNQVRLAVPQDRTQPPLTARSLSRLNEDKLEKAKAVLRELLLRKTRTHEATRKFKSITEVMQEEAAGDARIYAELFFIAVTESRLKQDATTALVKDAFENGHAYIFSQQDLDIIRKGLAEIKQYSRTYEIYLWGTKSLNRESEARLRSRLKNFTWDKGNLTDARSIVRSKGEAVSNLVIAESRIRAGSQYKSSYARLMYIALTELEVKRPIDFYHGFLNELYAKIYARLPEEDRTLIRNGLTAAARKHHLQLTELAGIPYVTPKKPTDLFKIRAPKNSEESAKELTITAIRNILRRIHEQGFPNAITAASVGQSLAQLIEVGARGNEQSFLELVSISQTENPRALPDDVKRTFIGGILRAAKTLGLSIHQQKLLKELLNSDRITILARLANLRWHEAEPTHVNEVADKNDALRSFFINIKTDFRTPKTAYEEGERVAAFLKLKENESTAKPFTHDEALALATVLNEVRSSHVAFYRGMLGRTFRLRMAQMNPDDKRILERGLRQVGLR